MRSPTVQLGAYLRPGQDQSRLLAEMVHGHARTQHGSELVKDRESDGTVDRAQFRALARTHLTNAPQAYAVQPPTGNGCFMVADARTGLIAWIPPHKERRATIFRPEDGVETFLARKQALGGRRGQQWTELDVTTLRHVAAARSVTRGITSTDRGATRTGLSR